jgi:hypothetical protein
MRTLEKSPVGSIGPPAAKIPSVDSPEQQFQMTGRQQLVHASLSAKSAGIGELYECALRALNNRENPGRLFLAAHAIREMTGDLPKVLDLPILTSLGRLGDQVKALESSWDLTQESSCHNDGQWSGPIDGHLQRFLGKVQKFFQWLRENRPKRRDIVTQFFRMADPAGLALPEVLEKPRADRWLELQDYFVKAAHRGQTTAEEMDAHLEELDQFLLETLCRQPSEDFSAIDAILSQEEEDD